SAARSASSRSTRRARWGSSSPVAPGAVTTASSQRSRTSLGTSAGDGARHNDDEAIGLRALARSLHLWIVLQRFVDDLPLDRGHRLHGDTAAGPGRALGSSTGEILQRGGSAGPITGRVDEHLVLAP